MSPVERGAVVEYPALFEFDSYPRPYVIVSDDGHPYYGEEYVGLAITTTELDPAVRIEDDAWSRGGLPEPSFVKPWQPILLKHDDILDAFGVLEPPMVDAVVADLSTVVGA